METSLAWQEGVDYDVNWNRKLVRLRSFTTKHNCMAAEDRRLGSIGSHTVVGSEEGFRFAPYSSF